MFILFNHSPFKCDFLNFDIGLGRIFQFPYIFFCVFRDMYNFHSNLNSTHLKAWDSRISNMTFPCIKCKIHKYTITQIRKYTNTKCLKDPTCAIFLKSMGFKDIKCDICRCPGRKQKHLIFSLFLLLMSSNNVTRCSFWIPNLLS